MGDGHQARKKTGQAFGPRGRCGKLRTGESWLRPARVSWRIYPHVLMKTAVGTTTEDPQVPVERDGGVFVTGRGELPSYRWPCASESADLFEARTHAEKQADTRHREQRRRQRGARLQARLAASRTKRSFMSVPDASPPKMNTCPPIMVALPPARGEGSPDGAIRVHVFVGMSCAHSAALHPARMLAGSHPPKRIIRSCATSSTPMTPWSGTGDAAVPMSTSELVK